MSIAIQAVLLRDHFVHRSELNLFLIKKPEVFYLLIGI